ncbi:MAG: aminomethyl-transferring glycine dehydrogenase subunit GcvPB [Puniceicoccaceae bacterium]
MPESPRTASAPVLTDNFREHARHYIPLPPGREVEMLQTTGARSREDLFRHIPENIRFAAPPPLPDEMDEEGARARLAALAERNRPLPGFAADGLPDWRQPAIVAKVAALRRLATSYTPYQPERSQGTLTAHWIYQCLLSELTGYDAVNSSLYDRSTALVEASFCSFRLKRDSSVVAVAGSLEPSDIAVLETHLADTPFELLRVEADPATGLINPSALRGALSSRSAEISAFAFPHVNTFGLLEDVDALTDACAETGVRSIAVVDPFLLGPGGLKPPARFGAKGADIAIGEGQHLALDPNFGGPGLGLFAIRFDAEHRNDIRNAPGRFVGGAEDRAGRAGKVMVLSTREQHIRKEKATSNICSNQAFLATLVGAALLTRGGEGLRAAVEAARGISADILAGIADIGGVRPAFPGGAVFTDLTLETDYPVAGLLESALERGFLAGTDVSRRIGGASRNLLKISVSDRSGPDEVSRLLDLLRERGGTAPGKGPAPVAEVPQAHLRSGDPELPGYPEEEVLAYYRRLDALNAAPEEGPYPLGSCTMKYNPYLNEWAAGRAGFTDIHPAAPESCSQGSLEVLFEIQEWFRAMTGLAGVTTQPVAGAQGELVGLKMFQAYHRSRGDNGRDVMLIPRSAHGTNFASAAMAGFPSGRGIALLKADATGCIDPEDLDAKIAEFGPRIAGIMITNPNTGGIFETAFAEIAEKVHAAGGLVYLDGANLNAIAGWIDLGAMGVDAVHSNLHKTWTIPHGGGGPGDGIVAVSERLLDFLPGKQIVRGGNGFTAVTPPQSIGTFHRHWGNFAHKVRCYAYLLRLGREGVPRMSATAVLAARYLQKLLAPHFPLLPAGTAPAPRMHEFILSLTEEQFEALESVGISRPKAVPSFGKMFLDFGYHAPTVAFPEPLGLMFEPTESFTKEELDRLAETAKAIGELTVSHPAVVRDGPHFTPVKRFDEVAANRTPVLRESLRTLPSLPESRFSAVELIRRPVAEIAGELKSLAAAAEETVSVS